MRPLIIFALTLLAGCCHLDHEQLASTAQQRIDALSDVAALSSADKTPELLDAIAAKEFEAWQITRARLLGDEVPAPSAEDPQ